MTFQAYSALSQALTYVQLAAAILVAVLGAVLARGRSRWILPLAGLFAALPILAGTLIRVARTVVTPTTMALLLSLLQLVSLLAFAVAGVIAAIDSTRDARREGSR